MGSQVGNPAVCRVSFLCFLLLLVLLLPCFCSVYTANGFFTTLPPPKEAADERWAQRNQKRGTNKNKRQKQRRAQRHKIKRPETSSSSSLSPCVLSSNLAISFSAHSHDTSARQLERLIMIISSRNRWLYSDGFHCDFVVLDLPTKGEDGARRDWDWDRAKAEEEEREKGSELSKQSRKNEFKWANSRFEQPTNKQIKARVLLHTVLVIIISRAEWPVFG